MNTTVLWYTARGAGAVSLILLSTVVVLGLLARARAQWTGWPRFLTATVHRDISLLTLVFLTLHIVTAAVDPFTHLGVVAALVPFGSYYRTFWLGLGTVAVEMLAAVMVTSLARRWVGAAGWRAVHWLSYACWPIAVIHGLGTGTDAFAAWMLGITVVCVIAVLAAALWRWTSAPGDPLADARRAAIRDASAEARRF